MLQMAAHKKNRMLLKPQTGVTVTKLTVISQGRMERIAAWVRAFGTYAEMDVTVSDILGRLRFGVNADDFERALDELSRALGFAGERPDKEWKEGPDNLWALDDTRYLLIECKSEVDVKRTDVSKREAERIESIRGLVRQALHGCASQTADRPPGNTHRERGGVYPRRGGYGRLGIEQT